MSQRHNLTLHLPADWTERTAWAPLARAAVRAAAARDAAVPAPDAATAAAAAAAIVLTEAAAAAGAVAPTNQLQRAAVLAAAAEPPAGKNVHAGARPCSCITGGPPILTSGLSPADPESRLTSHSFAQRTPRRALSSPWFPLRPGKLRETGRHLGCSHEFLLHSALSNSSHRTTRERVSPHPLP